jgi:hypothetical protein
MRGGVSGADAGSAGGQDWGALEKAIAGEVAVPGSPGFDRLPRPFNARYHDLLPRAVVLCAASADVVETLAFLAARGLETAIRSGGHCFAGHSSTGGVVVDVSSMRAVSIDGSLATVGAGARLGAVYDTLAADGRTIPGGTCPPVGIAGLTLGGGLGILGRSYGVSSDRLVAAEVVLADGRVVACDEHHDSDLFWALRGAGAGNFGVVASLVFRTVPEPDVTNVHLSWPFSDAAAVIGRWQARAPFGPDELVASRRGRPCTRGGPGACSRTSPIGTSSTGPRPTTAPITPAGPHQSGVQPGQRVPCRPVAARVNDQCEHRTTSAPQCRRFPRCSGLITEIVRAKQQAQPRNEGGFL